MSSLPQVPCPSCGKLNGAERKSCSTCGYAFVEGGEGESSGNIFGRLIGRITGRGR